MNLHNPAPLRAGQPGTCCCIARLNCGSCVPSRPALRQYMTLRGWLSSLAIGGMLSTALWYLQKDVAAAKQRMEQEDAKRAERLAARAAVLQATK
jgi:hypothetical protein